MIPDRTSQLRILGSKPADGRASVDIYRPFFTAGLITVLTAGCLLGAIALLGISRSGSYTNLDWLPHIFAHANSQLYGWVGFFVMGFALQHHAPAQSRERLFHRLAWTSLGLTAIAIALRFVGEPLAMKGDTLGFGLCLTSGFLQIVAVVAFLFNSFYTRHRTGERMQWPTLFVLTSLAWLLIVVIAEPIAFLGSHQANTEASVMFVAKWFPKLREAQFLGFVSMMVFGISLSRLSTCFAARPPIKNAGLTGYALWTSGLIWRLAGLDGNVGAVLLAAGAVAIVISSNVFAPFSQAVRSHKFMRASYAWLLMAGLLMVLQPLHLQAIGEQFSHAYVGAIRHAVTVGFISQMIVGVGSHVVARMRDLDDTARDPLWLTFWLLNIGNTLRVACEIATDYTPNAFRLMGSSGFVELLGLIVWAVEMARMMYGRRVQLEVRHAN